MKQFFLSILLAACTLGMSAKTFQPIIFDDPDFDIHSTAVTPEQRSFFDRYIQAMERINAGEDAEKFFLIEHAQSDDEGVAPLLGDINFDQGTPYNNKCPYINGGRAVTGCVATAMAMVLRYFQHPRHGTGTFEYTGGSEGAKTFVLDNNIFDWDNILPTYNGVTYTSAQADAISTLMLACGASLQMNYSKDGSGANTSKVNGLLKNNFYYKDAKYIQTGDKDPIVASQYWGEDAIRPDLESGSPLIFAGYPAINQTGHCFVIDGYKVVDDMYYYHVNWGWGGHGNNWCLLELLKPEYDNTDYSGYNIQMVYNIRPSYPQGITNVEAENAAPATKTMRNGQLFIERNNQTYTVQGQLIK